MKPSFQHLGFDSVDASFLAFRVVSPKFGFHWHYHPECEISYVLKGYGTRLVGDNVQQFEQGDLLFLGGGLPHTLITDEMYIQSGELTEVLVIQFPEEIIRQRVMEIVELEAIGRLITGGKRGYCFHSEDSETIGKKINQTIDLTGFKKYHKLLEVLNDLAGARKNSLASELYNPTKSTNSEERIDKVCSYIHDHFSEQIEIKELADLAFMNEAAFCRFFKRMTGKTALTYINDLRISKACQLLLSESLTISEAAYQSGYNSITHFNRSFVKRKGETPTTYRMHYSTN